MNCSYCCEPMDDPNRAVESVPLESKLNTQNLVLENTQGRPFLHLHAECIQTVIQGLTFGNRICAN